MPYNIISPNFGLLSSFDATQWSNTLLFRRGVDTVSLPTFSTNQGVYDDIITFLNGRGSIYGVSTAFRLDLQNILVNSATFGNNWAITLESNDRFKISCDDQFSISTVLSSDFLGFGSQSAVLEGSKYVVTGLNWGRGVVQGAYTITPAVGAGFTYLDQDLIVQDAITYFRQREQIQDLDDQTSAQSPCLERQDQTLRFLGRWYLDNNGYVNNTYHTSVNDISQWSSDSFRESLGFTGLETPSISGNYKTLKASRPALTAFLPSRPIQNHTYTLDQVSDYQRKIGGGYTSNLIGSYTQSNISFFVDSRLDQVDLSRHYLSFLNYANKGGRVSFYQSWGDNRRAYTTFKAGSIDYTSLYTSQDNGRYGRVIGNMIDFNNTLEFDGLDRMIRTNLRIEHE